MHRVVVGAVDLDAVETGFSGERGGLSKAAQSGFRPRPMSSPSASWRRDATMQRRKARACIARRSIRALRCGRRHRSGGSQDLPRHASLRRAAAGWTGVHHAPRLFPARSARPVRRKRRKKWWRRIRSPHAAGRIRVRLRSAVPSSWEESVVSGAIANRFAISRPQLNLKGDQTTIDRTSVISRAWLACPPNLGEARDARAGSGMRRLADALLMPRVHPMGPGSRSSVRTLHRVRDTTGAVAVLSERCVRSR